MIRRRAAISAVLAGSLAPLVGVRAAVDAESQQIQTTKLFFELVNSRDISGLRSIFGDPVNLYTNWTRFVPHKGQKPDSAAVTGYYQPIRPRIGADQIIEFLVGRQTNSSRLWRKPSGSNAALVVDNQVITTVYEWRNSDGSCGTGSAECTRAKPRFVHMFEFHEDGLIASIVEADVRGIGLYV